jgi:mono/diheme cytochrome c family protein
MQRLPILALLAGLASGTGCERAAGAPGRDALPERFEREDIVRYHMRLHLEDLHTIERRLLNGRLREATSLASLIGRPEKDPGMAPWTAQTRALVDAATALAKATTIEDALRLEVQVAVTCAKCHQESLEKPIFRAPGKAPRHDHNSSTVRMVSHQWAVDRLWEGLVGNSDVHWRAGLGVLSASPLPYVPTTDAPRLAKSLQARANQALRDTPTDSIDERARVYGEMLVTCAACHSTLKRNKRP